MVSLEDDADELEPGNGPSVHRQSLVRFRRPATGVSGHESLSSSEEDESRLSPIRGELVTHVSAEDEEVELNLLEVERIEGEVAPIKV